MLRAQDVYFDESEVVIILGVAERGERVKTGRNQGIKIDAKVLQAEWKARKLLLRPEDAFFPFSPEHFRRRWHAAKAALGWSWGGPPHHLRHAGAARDIEKKLRTLEEVRIRGRWKHLESVQRYSKTYLYNRVLSELLPHLLARGQELARGQNFF